MLELEKLMMKYDWVVRARGSRVSMVYELSAETLDVKGDILGISLYGTVAVRERDTRRQTVRDTNI